MKTFPKLALAAALAAGASGLAMTPAIAKKKEEAPQAPKLDLSKGVREAAQPAQDAVAKAQQDLLAAQNAPAAGKAPLIATANADIAAAEPKVAAVEAAATTDDDKYIAATMRYNLENFRQFSQVIADPNAKTDDTAIAKALDALIAAKQTPQADKARYYYRRGAIAYNSAQYPQARDMLVQAQQLGYTSAELPELLAKVKVQSGDVAGGLAEFDKMAAAGKLPENSYRYAIAQANQRKMGPETMTWLKKYVSAYPTAKNWRDVIVTFALQPNGVIRPDKSQQVDLFRLMRASKSLADQSLYEEYAQDVIDRGLPFEAASVLKEGMASGKIPAGSSNAKLLMTDAQKFISNEAPMATIEKQARAASSGDLASQTGDAYLGQDNYAKAVEMYKLALEKGNFSTTTKTRVTADDVNTHLGIAQAMSGDKAGAAQTFALVKGQPRAMIADLWNTWLQVGSTPA